MNWMIDGAHGDLYREAMCHPRLKPARDEWDLERKAGTKPRLPRQPLWTFVRRLHLALSNLASFPKPFSPVQTKERFLS